MSREHSHESSRETLRAVIDGRAAYCWHCRQPQADHPNGVCAGFRDQRAGPPDLVTEVGRIIERYEDRWRSDAYPDVAKSGDAEAILRSERAWIDEELVADLRQLAEWLT